LVATLGLVLIVSGLGSGVALTTTVTSRSLLVASLTSVATITLLITAATIVGLTLLVAIALVVAGGVLLVVVGGTFVVVVVLGHLQWVLVCLNLIKVIWLLLLYPNSSENG